MAGLANRHGEDFDDVTVAPLAAGVSDGSVLDEFIGNSIPSACIDILMPIAAIRALAETLQNGALNDREVADQFLAMIIAEADRMAVAARALLPLCELHSGEGDGPAGPRARRKNKAHVDNAKSI